MRTMLTTRPSGVAAVVLGIVLGLGAHAVAPAPASADEPVCEEWHDVRTPNGWTTQCKRWSTPGGGSGEGGTGVSGPPQPPTEGYFTIVNRPDDELDRCWEVRWTDVPGYEPDPDREWVFWSDAFAAGQRIWEEGRDEPIARCPGAEQPDPTGHIRSIWASTTLVPDNEFHVAPGWALTGMPAFLEISGGNAISETVALPAPFGISVTIAGSASYAVDWGDGTGQTGPHPGPGGPWPDGDIRHTYAVAGGGAPYTVTVTTTWTGSWTIGGGDPRPLPPITLQDSFDLLVREMQAVRTAGGR